MKVLCKSYHSKAARSIADTILFVALTDIQVQLLFVFRAWKRKSFETKSESLFVYFLSFNEVDSRKKTLAISLITLVLAQFILYVIYLSGLQPLSTINPASTASIAAGSLGRHTLGVIMDTELVLGAFADTVLALSIVVLLHRHRSKTPFSSTSSMIDRIMMYTVGSGLLTAAFALSALVTFHMMPGSRIFLVLVEMLPKCESIC